MRIKSIEFRWIGFVVLTLTSLRHRLLHMFYSGANMLTERHVRLFRNGRNQALRIPREFELDADEAILRREEGRLVIEPLPKKRLLAVLAGFSAVEETFPDVDAGLLPPDAIEL